MIGSGERNMNVWSVLQEETELKPLPFDGKTDGVFRLRAADAGKSVPMPAVCSYACKSAAGGIGKSAAAGRGQKVLAGYGTGDGGTKENEAGIDGRYRQHRLQISRMDVNPCANMNGLRKVLFLSFQNMLELLLCAGKPKLLQADEISAGFLRRRRDLKTTNKEYREQASGKTKGTSRVVTWLQLSVGAPLREEEETDTIFYSSASIETEDGQVLETELEADMSRNFVRGLSCKIDFNRAYGMEPLVIALQELPDRLQDYIFRFDILQEAEDNDTLLLRGLEYAVLNGGLSEHDVFAVFPVGGSTKLNKNTDLFNRLQIWVTNASGGWDLIGLGINGKEILYLR